MLTDITNRVNAGSNANAGNYQLRPLKIAKRTSVHYSKPLFSNAAKIVPKQEEPMKMADEPNYRFNKIFTNPEDMYDNYYNCNLQTENVYVKNELKLDFTEDITFFKNVIKKYTNPLDITYIKQTPYQVSNGANIFNPNVNQDPLDKCFKSVSVSVRFGDYILTNQQDGTVTQKFEPMPVYDISDEMLCDDEGETSRLENSDLDGTEDEDSDYDHDLDLGLDLEPVLNSSMIEEIPISLLSPTKPIASPSKLSSPKRQEMLFRALKNNSSPIKTLTSQRSGLDMASQQVTKPKFKSNYTKFDNSMTISAKAIMKMVDDSLVSSDTELYNHSISFFKPNTSSKNPFNFNINADDLMGALNDADADFDLPISQMRDLKL